MVCYFIVILICVSVMTNDIEHLLMCVLTICISLLEKYVFKFYAHFKIGLLVFSLLNYKNSLYILDTILWSVIWFASDLHSFCRLFFHSFGSVFWCTWFLIWWSLIYLFIFCLCLMVVLPNKRSWRFFPMFSSKSFIAIALIFRCLIHFNLIFVYGVR